MMKDDTFVTRFLNWPFEAETVISLLLNEHKFKVRCGLFELLITYLYIYSIYTGMLSVCFKNLTCKEICT